MPSALRSQLFAPSRRWLLVACVFALVLICYWPAMHGVLLWDDPAHVPRPEMRSLEGLRRIWFEFGATQQYYPVLFSAFWLEHRLWGDATTGYHLVNALLHATSCCLLASVLRRLWETRAPSPLAASSAASRPPTSDLRSPSSSTARAPDTAPTSDLQFSPGELCAWATALLFAVHPVSVESVAWITEQKNTLSLALGLLAVRVYLAFDDSRGRGSYVAATLLFLAAIGAKTSLVTLPPILLALLWWRRGALEFRRDVAPLLPWFLASVVAGLLTNWIERDFIGADGAPYALSFAERALLAGRVVWCFLANLVVPTDRAFFYHRWDVSAEAMGWIGFLAAAVIVTGALWWLRGKTRGPFAAWLALGGALFPVLGFFNVFSFQFSYVADHYHYVAAAAAFAAIAGGFAWLLNRVPRAARLGGIALGAVAVLGLAALSRQQSALYRDNETLFRANLALVPDSWMAHHILANTLSKNPARSGEAMAEYREALRCKPDHPDAHLGLAVELAKAPATQAEAIAHYEKAIALRPHYLEAHNNLGALLGTSPRREAASRAHLEQALRLNPSFPEPHLNLADVLARDPATVAAALKLYEAYLARRPDNADAHRRFANALSAVPGRSAEALREYERALELAPDSALAQFNFGNALAGAGRMEHAATAFANAVRLKPDFAAAHANLGNAYTALGRPADAAECFATALRHDPRLAWVHHNLALLLAANPARAAEAESHLEAALKLDPKYFEAHNSLAILCAQQGRLDEARRHWEQALAANPNYDTARKNLQLLEQMQQR